MIDKTKSRRKCDCWIAKHKILSVDCSCEVEETLRWTVVDDIECKTHSKWSNFEEAVTMSRHFLVSNFHIYDNVKKRKVLTYE